MELPLSAPILVTTGCFMGFCVATDLVNRTIPNRLTGLGMAAGLALASFTHGISGLLASSAGILLAILVLIGPFALGGIGGGDVKMMAAVGALVGPQTLLASLLAGMILGGLVAVAVVWRRGRLGEKLHDIGAMVRSAFATWSLAPLRAPEPGPDSITLPYSVPLALGTGVALSVQYTWGA